jgi:hypothetical protein
MYVRENANNTGDSTELLNSLSSKAEMLENLNEASEIDPLSIEYDVRHDNGTRDIVLQLTAGGPNIKLYVNESIVEGVWGGKRLIIEVSNKPLMENLKQMYEPLS